MKAQLLHVNRKSMTKAVSFTPFTKKLYHVLDHALNGKVWMFGQGYNEQTFNLPNAAASFDLGKLVVDSGFFIYLSSSNIIVASSTQFKILESDDSAPRT